MGTGIVANAAVLLPIHVPGLRTFALAFWLLVGLPARWLGGGDLAVLYSGTAALLCLVPGVIALLFLYGENFFEFRHLFVGERANLSGHGGLARCAAA